MKLRTCPKCKGYGVLRDTDSAAPYSLIECRYCNGSGKIDWIDHILNKPKYNHIVVLTDIIHFKILVRKISKNKGWEVGSIEKMTLDNLYDYVEDFCTINGLIEECIPAITKVFYK
jgi:hypothetical protein